MWGNEVEMNTHNHWTSGLAGLAGVAVLSLTGCAHAQEQGLVLSSTPVMQAVAMPREVCTDRTVVDQGQKSGAGALLGGIAGGAAGNAIGDGAGRAAATVIGAIGGVMLGDRIEGGGQPQARVVRQCSTQTVYEDRAVAYDVVYEYAGRQYSVRMAEPPGAYIDLQVSPVGAMPSTAPAQAYPSPSYAPQYAPQYAPYYAPQYISPPAVTRIIVAPEPYYAPPRVVVPAPIYIRPDRNRDSWRDRRDDRHDGDRGDRRGERRDDRRDDRQATNRDDRRQQMPPPAPAVRPAPPPTTRPTPPSRHPPIPDNDKM